VPRPSHRLDLVFVPHDRPIGHGHRLLQRLIDGGVVDERGAAGPEATRWVPGGFARIWVDDPGRPTLYANRLGGFRVSCPRQAANLVPAFWQAVTAWRAGAPRRLSSCPACGESHDLAELDIRPPAAFGRWALVVADAAEAALTTEARATVDEALGPLSRVLRR